MHAYRLTIVLALFVSSVTLLSACGGSSSSGGSSTTTITVSASPTAITTTGTSTITATVSSGGAAVADGTTVNFNLSSSTYGSLSAASATTTGGVATVTFTGAGGASGTVTVTASSGGGSGTAALAVGSVATSAAGGIVFVSASPQVIGIKGAGQVTSSAITFNVTDASGAAVSGAAVSFNMLGPSGGRQPSAGGEYIGADDGTPTTASGTTDSAGNVSVLLNSGDVAGPVSVSASVTVGSLTYQTSSSVVSIGGGVPSATHFTIARDTINLPGLDVAGATSTLTAFVADRFGNYNVLQGTSVSFYTEAGAVDRSVTLDDTGQGQVTFRTQDPMPIDVGIDATDIAGLSPYDLAFGTSYAAGTGIGTPNPRDGWVTVLAVVQGEESFTDTNGNGLYDSGEPFVDVGEPFLDANDNGVWDPGEFYIDENGNGSYDAGNGVWDGPNCPDSGCRTSKLIFQNTELVFTGQLYCDTTLANPFSVADGGSLPFTLSVHDRNFNMPVAGTTITVTASYGTLMLDNMPAIVDGLSAGPYLANAQLVDPQSGTAVATPSSVTVTATPPSGSGIVGCTVTIYGQIN